ncbi:hypothetical protein AKJ65_03310 [candidate division MSBL1 archaeon SCGC-AAA259E19]|uniref:Uncharacterized protein n=1 Tax=candidate division MSBL1 archaeon SCGC-AAA259E19 TaxID=1698264 RepID=A0A133UKU0_9EURY|nr:hypothetical protein AKJ65_03310 [candidate division MSBL1 archaeon SCGC-AAA259E19]
MDYNPPEKLERIIDESQIEKIDDDYVIITIESWEKGAEWIIRAFQKVDKNRYVLEKERIREISFSIAKVKNALSEFFENIKIMDIERNTQPDPENRVFFMCEQ